MKLLLHADIEKLGYFGDVVDVQEGYARNYLLPQRLAVTPTEENIKEIEEERAARVEARRLAREALVRAAEKVEGAEVTITALVNEQGHLFGSISPHDIAGALAQQGHDVQTRHVVLPHSLRERGRFEVKLHFMEDVEAQIHVNIVSPEDAQTDDNPSESAAAAAE